MNSNAPTTVRRFVVERRPKLALRGKNAGSGNSFVTEKAAGRIAYGNGGESSTLPSSFRAMTRQPASDCHLRTADDLESPFGLRGFSELENQVRITACARCSKGWKSGAMTSS